jgi:hypothetical protein
MKIGIISQEFPNPGNQIEGRNHHSERRELISFVVVCG